MSDINKVLPDIKLRFNIEHPNLEECYAFGYECALAEIAEKENPYRPETIESEYWLEGWWAGFYGEQPIHELSAYVREKTEAVLHAANDEEYQAGKVGFFTKVLEISGIIAISTLLGYQVIDLVA